MTSAAAAPPAAARPARRRLVTAALWLMAAGTLLAGALTPRDLSGGEDAPVWNTSADLLAFDLTRGLTALLLAGSATVVLWALLRRGLPRAGLALWCGYAAFVATNFLLPVVAGREPVLEPRLLVPPVAFTAAWLAGPPPLERVLATIRGVLRAFVWTALAAALLAPDRAVAPGHEGIIPGLDVRLYGIGGGATTLGALSAAALTLELVATSRGRLRWLHLGATALVLLLTQAKTSWGFVVLVVAAWSLRRVRPARLLPRLGLPARAAAWLVGLAALAGLAAAGIAAAGRVDAADVQGTDNLLTLTGRTYIWATTVVTWLESPLFGYGLGLWESDAFRAAHGGFDHAHNQYLHALGSAGLVGLCGLAAYLGAAWRVAVRAARAGAAAPLVLLCGELFLCLTNVPLRAYYLLDAFALLHLATFTALLAAAREHPAPRPAAPAGAPLQASAAAAR